MHTRMPVWFGLPLLLVSALPAVGQVRLAAPRLPGESPRAAQRLQEAQQLAANGQFAEAIEEYQRLLAEAGDELLPRDPQAPQELCSVRQLCHRRLAALPPAALQLYRRRVDPQAEKWLDQGRRQRDGLLPRRIVNDLFCSRHTDQALDLLGDLAFERGDFLDADACWSMLLPPASPSAGLHYPDSRLDPALTRAKVLLARWCRGLPRAADLAGYQKQHGQAEGYLAGRQGKLADILADLAKRIDAAPTVDDAAWPTFAGSPARQRILAAAPRCRWLDEPWRVALDAAPPPAGQVRSPTQAAQALLYHPIIVQERVWLSDGRGVNLYDLWTGKHLSRWDLAMELKVDVSTDAKVAATQGVRHTLTAAAGRVYARLGEPAYGQRMQAGAEAKGDSYLVCLDAPLGENKPTLRWQVKPEADEEGTTFFEGAAVVAEGRVFIAWSRYAQARLLSGVDCYDADSGQRRWRQAISEARDVAEPPSQRQHLLTLAGPHVVACTHAGAVVALEQLSGRRIWALRYPRRGYVTADGAPTPRDLTPPVYDSGRVFVAPADSERIWCLDNATGQLLWESQPVEVVHLLGVAKDRLIFTTGSAPRGIRALVASTGQDLRSWLQPDDGQSELPGLGRGLLAGDKVFWPTVNGWRILRQEDGRPSRDDFVPLGGMPSGNLVSAQGCLVVATDRELIGYVPPARFLDSRRKQAAVMPGSAQVQYRVALAEADAGHGAAALHAFTQAGKLDPARHEDVERLRHRVLNELAGPDIDIALKQFPATDALHLQILAHQAGERIDPRQALRDWQRIAEFRTGTIFDAQAIPQPARLVAIRRIDALARQLGLDEAVERKANALAASGVTDNIIDRLWRDYPNALATRDHLRQAAARSDGRALEQRRRLLAFVDDKEEHAANLTELAKAYERLGHHAAARATWIRLRQQHGDDRAAMGLKKVKPSSLARLGTLEACWDIMLHGERLLALSADAACFVRGDSVSCRDPATGTLRWSRRLESPIIWLAHHADTLLAAGPRLVARMRLTDGELLWQVTAGPNRFSAFQCEAGYLFLLADDRLLALDLETGGCDWHADCPGLAFQVGEAWLACAGRVLHATTGRAGQAIPGQVQWIGDQPLVVDSHQAVLFNRSTGKPLWTYRFARAVSLAGTMPHVLPIDDGVLLLIARNHATEIVRLANGLASWTQPILHGRLPIGPRQWGTDGDRVFIVADQSLQTYSTASGKALWAATLPLECSWNVTVTHGQVLACPAHAVPQMDPVRTYRRLLMIDPMTLLPCNGPAGIGPAVASATTRTLLEQAPSRFMVLAFDTVTGQLIRQLDFTGHGPFAQLDVADGIAIVSTLDKAWAFR